MSNKLRECPIRAVEIFSGRDEKWKGWYNIFNSDGTCIMGPLEPYKSIPLLLMIDEWNTRHGPKHETVEQMEQFIRDFSIWWWERESAADYGISLDKLKDQSSIIINELNTHHGNPEAING